MAYCTQADILEQITESELIQLTDDANLNTIDTDAVTRAIVDADAEIDAYCTTKYDTPLSPVPAMLRKISVDISLYNLFSRRPVSIPDDRQARYDAAIRFLRDISRGIVSFGGDDTPAQDDEGGPESTTLKSDMIFGRGRTSDSSSGSLDNY